MRLLKYLALGISESLAARWLNAEVPLRGVLRGSLALPDVRARMGCGLWKTSGGSSREL